MTIKRQKISKNVTRTTNMKTGTTRYTHSIKTGASTRTSQSWSSNGNTRRTSTSNVGGVVSRKQTSTSPKKYKSSSGRRSSGRRGRISKLEQSINNWTAIIIISALVITWIVEWFLANPIFIVLFCLLFTIICLWIALK